MEKTVYISAPITGRTKYVIKSVFLCAEKELAKFGYNTINPTKLCNEKMTIGECMGTDIKELVDNADAVYFCRGWEKSKGCLLEFAAAKIYGKEIMFE